MEKQQSTETHILFKTWLMVLIAIGILKVWSIVSGFFAAAPDAYEIFSLVSNLAITICFIMLYRLKKWAFWGVALISLCSFVLCVVLGFGLLQLGFITVAFIVLLSVMQLKKNDISAWRALS